MGTSWKRQEFLIIGKDRSSILGFIIYPSLVFANCNEELTGLAQALRPPLIISENTLTAKAIALPTHTMEQVIPIQDQQVLAEGTDMETAVLWIQYIGHD